MDGTAILLCEGAFDSPGGKTTHGLVRHTKRYKVLAVIDSNFAGLDAGEFLDARPNGIPIVASLQDGMLQTGTKPDYLVIGVATDGGFLPPEFRPIVLEALRMGINVDSGLHHWLGDDEEFRSAAAAHGAHIRDIRCSPSPAQLHFFTGKIRDVRARKICVLGIDSACGKRTTAVLLTQELERAGISTVFIGTGQTAWFQGAEYCMILDAMINDFITGEIEHLIWTADREKSPDVIIVEGQGSLTHPAYPAGYELLAGAAPEGIIYQVAPGRLYYDGFPEYHLPAPDNELQIIDLIRPGSLLGFAINGENLRCEAIRSVSEELEKRYGLPACNPLTQGCGAFVPPIRRLL